MKRITTLFCTLFALFISHTAASSGLFFNVSATGTPANLSITLCLNGNGPLSCQNYIVSALNLSISTMIPNHVYTAAGIKVNTPGYVLSGCTPTVNGYCLFSANSTTPTRIVVSSTSAFSVGGTVSGLSGTVVLQNNGGESETISSNGSFTFSTPVTTGAPYLVTVLTQPVEQICTITNGSGTIGSSNITNVGVSCAITNTTITVSSTGTIPVNNSAGSLTVTNTGTTYNAYNVSATLPGSWTGVTQDATDCITIAPNGGTCTLTFTSTKPYVAQGNITVSGDNIISPPTTALAFSMSDYLVFAVPTGSTALVVANNDVATQDSPGINWSTVNTAIPGIYQTSTSPPCDGNTDGACTSNVIVSYYTSPYNYAAGLCYEIISDNTGTIALGTWFLPAICNFNSTFGVETGSGCAGSTPSVYTTLYSLGFLQDMASSYWTSTECDYVNTPETNQCNGNLGTYAWTANFGGGNNAFTASKTFTLSARCVRVMPY